MSVLRSAFVWLVRRALSLADRHGLPNRYIADEDSRIAGVVIRWRAENPRTLRGVIAECPVGDVDLRFFVHDEFDEIQSCHCRGMLYEREELEMIARRFRGGTFVDIGANVGNHAVWAVRILSADRVIAFEPDPLSSRICQINIALNGCTERVELRRVGLSDAAGHALVAGVQPHNLGSTKLAEAAKGPLELVRGDDALAGEKVGFLKIDTEGFELKVLEGLAKIIARDRPPIFIELENANVAAFESFCGSAGYRVIASYRRYGPAINLLAVSGEEAG